MTDETETMQEILRWVKIMGVQEAKSVLNDALSDEDGDKQADLRRAYHLTNGSNTRDEIASLIDYSGGWVSERHGEWHDLGLVGKVESGDGSYKHVITLDEAGIEVPDIADPEDEDAQ